MAPPTRHSLRLGSNSHLTTQKEDENAGASLAGRPPTTRTLRGRKDPINNTALTNTKNLAINGKDTLVSNNTRKRILDDRTNNVKANNNQTSLHPSKSALGKNQAPSRKPSTTLNNKKSIMVLDEVKTNEAVPKRLIKPIKKDVNNRSTSTLKKTNTSTSLGANSKPNLNPSQRSNAPSLKSKSISTSKPTTTSNSHHPSASSRRRWASNRNGASINDHHSNIPNDLAYDAGHVNKKVRTSEPEEIEKENMAGLGPSTAQRVEEVIRPSKRQVMQSLTREDYETMRAEASEASKKAAELICDDLDAGDEEDPLMVTEYVAEIYEYMRDLELETLPESDYMSRQNELTWKMRGVLVDWIIEVHSKFRLLPETLYLAINLMDRFLTKRTVALIKFQLVGVTALFLAAKYEEVICPSVTNFLYMTDGGYDCEEILKAEMYMLEMLDWDLRYPNPLNFLRRVSKADEYDIQSRTFAKYFMEISVVDYRLISTPPSLLAATSIWLARKLLERGDWNANLIVYAGYSEQEILPVAQTMLDYILRSGCKTMGMGLEPNFVGAVGYEGGYEHGNLFKKYATRKFFRVSELVRDWAIDRYTYETPTGWEWDKLEEWKFDKRRRSKKDDKLNGIKESESLDDDIASDEESNNEDDDYS
ncbi:hypothetical protein O181_062704 [Austropuccinia psidii MF-1]|uniref:Cyclin N-terminal domain-containing protein n=1 Tax=Austropuccinia psidii MF-1 TaxID=1389203 RepID=A0A9Q3EKM7_9BASI|nr:hypothetical protein [Austropuccinia psidii MF-1]